MNQSNSALWMQLEQVDLAMLALEGGLEVAQIYSEEAVGGDSRNNLMLQQLRCLRETASSVRGYLDEAISMELHQRKRGDARQDDAARPEIA